MTVKGRKISYGWLSVFVLLLVIGIVGVVDTSDAEFVQHAQQSSFCECGMDDNGYYLCTYDDSRAIVFLWRHGTGEECNLHDASEFHRDGICRV